MPPPVACARHPRIETRLRCSTCEVPICPACAVTTPVGMKCPDCGRLPRSAQALGTPKQLSKGVATGAGAAILGAVVLTLILQATGGFFTVLLSFGAGVLVGDAVRRGAEGNGASRFRTIAIVAACLMIAGTWVVGFGAIPRGYALLMLPAAGYGAATRFPWA